MAPSTVLSLSLALSSLVRLATAGGIVSDPKVFAQQKFNYVIVGGGTAGLALASRLSENKKNIVGVIEAGQNLPDDPLIFTPALFGYAQGNPMYDWMLETVPQPGLDGKVVEQPRGKILGGSSALNYMAYDRASSDEYDVWSQFGGSNWDWNSLYPYMKKVENFHAPTVNTPFHDPRTIDTKYEGVGGPVQVSFNDWYSDITAPYLSTVNSLSIPTDVTPDDGTATGVYNCRMSVNRTSGRRSYAANTYHTAAVNRPNYFVLLGAEATKIVFDSTTYKRDTDAVDAASADAASTASSKNCNAKATGVNFTWGGKSYTAKATNEIILSAGSLKTPQLLELSGVGDKHRLQPLGIPLVYNLPGVGENLQDHIFVPNSFALKPGYTTFDILANDPAYAAVANATYYANGTGIYAATHSAFAFFDLQTFMPKTTVSQLLQTALHEASQSNPSALELAEFQILQDYITDGGIGQVEIIMYPGHFSPSDPVPGTSYISILMALQHPWSRGSVHINSTSPTKPPVIDPKYFDNSFDLQVMIKACQFARKIAQTKPLSAAVASFQDPAASVDTDAEFEAYVKTAMESVYHPIGTSALAPENQGGVVNGRLVVYGTSNLRVVDASIIPLHMATHMQQTVYAIAEQAAVFITADN